MISSTIKDLEYERVAIESLFQKYSNIVELIGAGNLNTQAESSSSYLQTIKYAEECDLYILILGGKFGFELRNGKSATEIEFDKALIDDPTKILIFKKDDCLIDDKQQKFIDKVSDYSTGYWRTPFKHTQELSDKVENSFLNWLYKRSKRKEFLSNVDRFINLALSKKNKVVKELYYKIDDNHIELDYLINDSTRSIHIDINNININFWKTFSELNFKIEEWIYED